MYKLMKRVIDLIEIKEAAEKHSDFLLGELRKNMPKNVEEIYPNFWDEITDITEKSAIETQIRLSAKK